MVCRSNYEEWIDRRGEIAMQVQIQEGKDILGVQGLAPVTFSTGSTGYRGTFKIVGLDGGRYQCNFQIVLIGSKPASDVTASVTSKSEGRSRNKVG